MLSGRMSQDDMLKFLNDLADRGETVDDIVGAARALRKHVTGLIAPADAIDCCGTGGSGRHTLNISTATALVVAANGVPVAKHGNRSHNNPSGAADVLEALDIPLDPSFDKLEEALDVVGFCFLMAPLHHRAMAHVAPVRKAIGRRTIFNLLGPLTNPASVRKQLVGVPDRKWLRPMSEALQKLGGEAAWVVHSDSLDEVTLAGPTYVARFQNADPVEEVTLTPEDFGLPMHGYEDIRGADAAYNARALQALLEGKHDAYFDVVCANAAAALVMAGAARDVKDGVQKARDVIEDGRALDILNDYRRHVS
jgi:anthranilate phosphoribosyltransferase